MDFTIRKYLNLLNTLKSHDFSLVPVGEFEQTRSGRVLVIRQDVDLLPQNALGFAEIQASNGIRSTFYFRAVSKSFNEEIISKIAEMGHEIGYHYEDLSLWHRAWGMGHGKINEAEWCRLGIDSFTKNLDRLRTLVPVKTICMHGSPLCPRDSRLLWKYYDYRELGIMSEPYFDIDFSNMLYLTDTGRRWDGTSVSVRDKGLVIQTEDLNEDYYKDWVVKPIKGSLMRMTQEGLDFQKAYVHRLTDEIIMAAKEGSFAQRAMITFHPQRWTDRMGPWAKELVWQNLKNLAKYYMVKWDSY